MRDVWKKVSGFLTPPLWASIVSILVALNPPLQHVLEVHMRPVQGAITQAGNCSIPLTLIVLGAYFHRSEERPRPPCLRGLEEDSPAVIPGEGRTIFLAIFARMVVVPALFLPFMVIGAIHKYPPVFQEYVPVPKIASLTYQAFAVLFLFSATYFCLHHPPRWLWLRYVLLPIFGNPQAAKRIFHCTLQVTQSVASSSVKFERLISRTIFWSYCLVSPPAMVGYGLIAMLITRL
jgi:auxin efflux carrier family protein